MRVSRFTLPSPGVWRERANDVEVSTSGHLRSSLILYLMVALSSSGVQVGAVRSPFGVVGGWTTVHHAPLSPVGKFIDCV